MSNLVRLVDQAELVAARAQITDDELLARCGAELSQADDNGNELPAPP